MFTIPAAGGSGIILVARPSASSGTITNATNAYDLPSSRADDPPYTTSADRATVTGSFTAGTPDYVTVEYNTFPSKVKTNFSQCDLLIGVSALLTYTALDSSGNAVLSSLDVDYQIDGTNWINIKSYDTWVISKVTYGAASNTSPLPGPYYPVAGSAVNNVFTKETLSVTIPSSSFPSNLSSLKVRFVLGTCKNSTVTTYQSSGSYQIWDIRANIS